MTMKKLTKEQEMALSELLFKALGLGCWHHGDPGHADECLKCQCAFQRKDYEPYPCEETNPNLFTRESFMDIFDAVMKECPRFFDSNRSHGWDCIKRDLIAVPHLQLEVLRWLLEQDNEGERLQEIIEKGEGE